jgi:hypothetical protein
MPAGWQRALSVSYAKLGNGYRKAGPPGSAIEALAAGHAIMTGLVVSTRIGPNGNGNFTWFDRQIKELYGLSATTKEERSGQGE